MLAAHIEFHVYPINNSSMGKRVEKKETPSYPCTKPPDIYARTTGSRLDFVLKIKIPFFFWKFDFQSFVSVLHRSPFFSMGVTGDVQGYLEGLNQVNGAVVKFGRARNDRTIFCCGGFRRDVYFPPNTSVPDGMKPCTVVRVDLNEECISVFSGISDFSYREIRNFGKIFKKNERQPSLRSTLTLLLFF